MEKQYHIGLNQEMLEGAKFAILPGDPGRVPKIASQISRISTRLAINREYTSYLVDLKIGSEDERLPKSISIIIMSTGIGCPSSAIAIEELAKLGVTHFLRVGTAGSLQKHVKLGDIVIATGSVREEGTSKQYVPLEFPAVADHDMVAALRMAAKSLGVDVHLGICHSKDAFYAEQFNDHTIPLRDENKARWDT